MGNSASSTPLDSASTTSNQSWTKSSDPASGGMSRLDVDMMGYSSQGNQPSQTPVTPSSKDRSRRRTTKAVAESPALAEDLDGDNGDAGTRSKTNKQTRTKERPERKSKGRSKKSRDSMNSHLEEIEAFVNMIKKDKHATKTLQRSLAAPVAAR